MAGALVEDASDASLVMAPVEAIKMTIAIARSLFVCTSSSCRDRFGFSGSRTLTPTSISFFFSFIVLSLETMMELASSFFSLSQGVDTFGRDRRIRT
jgi:hypothetical protein